MTAGLCHPSRSNMLTGKAYTDSYLEQELAKYEAQAEPPVAVESPIEKYLKVRVEAPVVMKSETVRKVCASVKMAWTVNRPQPAPILAVGWPVGVMVVVE